MPTVGNLGGGTDAGIVIVYGASFEEMYRSAAAYVDRILKEDKPADLPVERPTRFELIINARAAHAIGISIPPSLKTRADRVIQ